ncbi:uncharacterized protein [Myotis yumanensis]|uniref:uncharacterized protein n=1 Tax=Myotis yumanensis TaxID=159337 RepID=UPI0038D1B284
MGGLRMAARKPTNLAKVENVQQERDESPAAFLEQIMEAYHTYTLMNPEAPESKAAVIMSSVNQSAADIRKKLQKVDRLGEKSLQDLLEVAEKVYNNQEPPEDRQARAMVAASDKQTQNLAKILLATTADTPGEQKRHLRRLADNQGEEGSRGCTRTFGRTCVPSTRLTQPRRLISTDRETGCSSRGTARRPLSHVGRAPTS